MPTVVTTSIPKNWSMVHRNSITILPADGMSACRYNRSSITRRYSMFEESPNLSNILLLQRVQRIIRAVKQDNTLRNRPSLLLQLSSRTSTEEIEQVLGCDYTQLLENPTIPELKKDDQPQKKRSTVQFHQQNGATTAVSTFSNDAQGYVQVNQPQMPLPAPVPLAQSHYPITSPVASSGYKSEDASPLAFSSGLVPNQFVFPEPGNNFTISNMVKEECYQNIIDQAWND